MEEEIEEQRDIAVEILIKAGVLKRCPIHEDIILAGSADIENAYRLANSLYTKGELAHVFHDRSEMTDIIKDMFNYYGGANDCPICMKD